MHITGGSMRLPCRKKGKQGDIQLDHFAQRPGRSELPSQQSPAGQYAVYLPRSLASPGVIRIWSQAHPARRQGKKSYHAKTVLSFDQAFEGLHPPPDITDRSGGSGGWGGTAEVV